jgi:peptidoglycan/LPS O-acetylase OafA/YrhL
VPALDGLRGVAVLMVIAFHVFGSEPLPAEPLLRALHLSSRVGQTGVELFFVLSGFLITGILYDTKGSAHFFRNFCARRTLRIFPLYYGVLAAAFLLPRVLPGGAAGWPGPAGYDAARAHQAWLWAYAANLVAAAGGGLGCFDHFWSLSIEEQFYLVWPVVVLRFCRGALIRVCAGCLGAAALLRLMVLPYHPDYSRLTPFQIDGLVLGSLLALVARGPRGLPLRAGTACTLLAPFSLSVLLLYVWKSGDRDVLIQVVKPTLLAALFGLVLVLAVVSPGTSPAGRFFASRPLRLVGKYSYAMYVFHPFAVVLVGWACGALFRRRPSPAAALLVKAVAVPAVTLLAARLSWVAYESRFIKLKRFFDYDVIPRGRAGAVAATRPGPRPPALSAADITGVD